VKIARKFTLALALAAFAVLTVQAVLREQREVSFFEADMQHDHHVVGRAFAAAFTSAWQRAGHAEALTLLHRANRAENHVKLRWVWLDHPASAARKPRAPGVDRSAIETGRDVTRVVRGEGGAMYTYIPLSLSGAGHPSALELAEPLDEESGYIHSTTLRTVGTTVILGLLFVVLAVPLGGWLVGRPMHRLIMKARRIGSGDLTGPLVLDTHDELGQLADEMNAMSEQLAHAQRRIMAEAGARIDALSQLRHADRLNTVGKLASGIAHELGSPLNVVAARAKMIETGSIEGEEAQHSARIIGQQARRMTGIIRQLLEFARPRGPKKARHDIAHIAKETLEMLQPLADKQRVRMSLEPADSGTELSFDEGQMSQVLTNLVGNAIQAMPDGGALTVRVFGRRATPPPEVGGASGDYVCVSVEDEGIGMTEEVRSRIFEPFFTTKDVGEGTGLGLSVSYGIVREHGGWVEAESEPGKGSTFTIYIPARADSVRPEQLEDAPRPRRLEGRA
jgi:signal transduction histidine kinase